MRLLDVKNHSDAELADLAKAIELAANERAELEDAQISRYNGIRSVSFDANVGDGFSKGQALDALGGGS